MNKHALIIDDSVNNIKVLAGLLTMESLTHTQIVDTSALEEHLDEQMKVDVIFLDLEMPHLDGYAVFSILKTKPYFEGVPIIAYTVHANEIKTVNEIGFDGFIGKPLNANRFSSQLARILNGEKVWEAQ